MAWRRFSELTPTQAVVAQQQVEARFDPVVIEVRKQWIVKPFDTSVLDHREYWVVDGEVKGSRLRWHLLSESLSDVAPEPAKGSLRGWTGGPLRWSLDV